MAVHHANLLVDFLDKIVSQLCKVDYVWVNEGERMNLNDKWLGQSSLI